MDAKLRMQAEARAGGQTHTVVQVINAILLAEKLLPDPEAREIVDRNERRLRAFVATGRIGELDGK